MGLFDKLKDILFEEEAENNEEIEQTQKLAKKIEIPVRKIVEEKKVEPIKEEIKVKEEPVEVEEEEEEVEIKVEEIKKPKPREESKIGMDFEEEDFVLDTPKDNVYIRDNGEFKPLYPDKREESYVDSIKKEASYSNSYYDKKDTKVFIPSPIISPIYGILDKNYKKEEVKEKKDVRLSSSRSKIDLDSVRSKAYGDEVIEVKPEAPKKVEKVKETVIERTFYDVNKEKPTVKGITLEDADEYYNDLGLAYNVDYSDKPKDKNLRRSQNNNDDNLFDLIESMYDKED